LPQFALFVLTIAFREKRRKISGWWAMRKIATLKFKRGVKAHEEIVGDFFVFGMFRRFCDGANR